ncbi:MAG TPA: hypothetical protein VGD45_20605 [Steroidobacter sp.]|uniref:hypothetical protein n=1 Tax=Steroidobacter sp. TaxID=1978227 RepID=UPI002ED800CF
MAVRFFWRFEGTTLDATHDHVNGSADNTATANGSASLSTTAARVGTNGGLFPASGGNQYRFDTSTDMVNRLLGACAFSLRITTAPSAVQGICNISGTDGSITFQALATGEIRVITNLEGTGESQLTTDGAGITTNTWYTVAYRWDHANDLRSLEVYNSSGVLIDSVLDENPFTAPANLVNTNGLRIGNTDGNDAVFHLDNFFIADLYAEPLPANATITSYTAYDAGGSSVTIDSIDDVTLTHGQTGVTITGTGFGASQGSGQVIVSPTDNVNDVAAIAQTITSWSDTSIDFTAVLSSFAFGATLYVFVVNDDDESNADGEAVSRIIASATLDFTGVNFFFDENGDPVQASGMTLYVWRSPRPPSSVGTPDQIITSVATDVDGELSQAINLGSLDSDDTVFCTLFAADGTDLYWAGEKLPIYA